MHQFWAVRDMGVGRKVGQWANIPLQGLHRDVQTVGAISGPTADLEPSIVTISPVMNLHGQQKTLW